MPVLLELGRFSPRPAGFLETGLKIALGRGKFKASLPLPGPPALIPGPSIRPSCSLGSPRSISFRRELEEARAGRPEAFRNGCPDPIQRFDIPNFKEYTSFFEKGANILIKMKMAERRCSWTKRAIG
jgi:hypothetical protein